VKPWEPVLITILLLAASYGLLAIAAKAACH
jgi:hypothetical protein